MRTEELTIAGMSCEHCVRSLEKELGKLDGVRVKSVVVGRALVEFDEARVSRQDLARAVDDAGFRLVPE